jgi:hypothetical protein
MKDNNYNSSSSSDDENKILKINYSALNKNEIVSIN